MSLPPAPKAAPRILRCIQVPAPNPLADLSDDAITDLVDGLDGEVAVIIDLPAPRRCP